MIRILFMAVTAALFCTACTNNDTPKVENAPAQAVSEEQKLRDAVTKYPDSTLLKENLIQYLEDVGNIDMAIAEINKALKKDSLNARFWFKKGDLHIIDEDTAAAIRSYLKSLEIFPEPSVIMTLGSVYATKKNDSALLMADALLIGSKAAANKEALFIKGFYYNNIGDKKKCILFMDECLKLDYTYMFAYREKTIAQYDLGKYEDALKTIERAVTLDNRFDEGYYWMGRCYEKLNKKQDAIESYQAALLINKEYAEAEDALKKLGG